MILMQIRAYSPKDCPQIAQLFYDTVHSVCLKDYTEEQAWAWADGSVNLDQWNRSFLERHTYIAEQGGNIVGFGDITPEGYLDRLYVHKDFQGQGIASALCNALEQSVQSSRILVHASVTAKPFFEKRGYRLIKKQIVERHGIQLANFVLELNRPTPVCLRRAKPEEAQAALSFIDDARRHQREQGFIHWADDYPNLSTVQNDILKGNGYFLADGKTDFGYVCISFDGEPAYQAIEGRWHTGSNYAVIHRIAFGKARRGSGASKELFRLAKSLCLSRGIHAIRIDTGQENQKMRHILQREGYRYCGTVYYSGSPRMAYELDF